MIKINDKEFAILTEYLQDNFGLNLIKKRTLIESRLNNNLVNSGFTSYRSYMDYVFNDKSGKQISQIVNLLTTNFSYFMREWEHFRYFRDHILPELKSTIRDNDLRTWSAGCSTGQEPYTMAMLIMDFLGEQKKYWDTKVLATDISVKALGIAKEGIYDEEGLNNIPTSWRFAYFHKATKNRLEIHDAVKSEVVFRRFNLIDEHFPFKKKFHVIFCRNVMIYFNETTKENLIKKFYDAMEIGGYLFIGQSESINRNETRFKYVMPSIYKKVV